MIFYEITETDNDLEFGRINKGQDDITAEKLLIMGMNIIAKFLASNGYVMKLIYECLDVIDMNDPKMEAVLIALKNISDITHENSEIIYEYLSLFEKFANEPDEPSEIGKLNE